MPTYSYLCTECAHDFDIHQSFTDESLTVCPVCSGQLRKVFNSIGVTFNGPGFYRTDSRSSKSDAASGGKKPAEKKESGSGTSSSGDSGSGTSSSASKDSGAKSSSTTSGTATAKSA